MTEFKDSEGRKWTLILTLGSAKRVYDNLGVDLLNPASMAKLDEKGEVMVEESTLLRFIADDLFIGSVVALFITKQAKERGISEQDVFDIFDGDTIKSAQSAFLEEYKIFFTARGNAPGVSLAETLIESVQELNKQESLGEMLRNLPEARESGTIETTLGTS